MSWLPAKKISKTGELRLSLGFYFYPPVENEICLVFEIVFSNAIIENVVGKHTTHFMKNIMRHFSDLRRLNTNGITELKSKPFELTEQAGVFNNKGQIDLSVTQYTCVLRKLILQINRWTFDTTGKVAWLQTFVMRFTEMRKNSVSWWPWCHSLECTNSDPSS